MMQSPDLRFVAIEPAQSMRLPFGSGNKDTAAEAEVNALALHKIQGCDICS